MARNAKLSICFLQAVCSIACSEGIVFSPWPVFCPLPTQTRPQAGGGRASPLQTCCCGGIRRPRPVGLLALLFLKQSVIGGTIQRSRDLGGLPPRPVPSSLYQI